MGDYQIANPQQYLNERSTVRGGVINGIVLRDGEGQPRIAVFSEESTGWLCSYDLQPTNAPLGVSNALRMVCNSLRGRVGGAPSTIRLRMYSVLLERPVVQQAMIDLGLLRTVDELQPFFVSALGTVWTLRNFFMLSRYQLGPRGDLDDLLMKYEIRNQVFTQNQLHVEGQLSASQQLFGQNDNRPAHAYRLAMIAQVNGRLREVEFLAYTRDFNGAVVLERGRVAVVDAVWLPEPIVNPLGGRAAG